MLIDTFVYNIVLNMTIQC